VRRKEKVEPVKRRAGAQQTVVFANLFSYCANGASFLMAMWGQMKVGSPIFSSECCESTKTDVV